MAENLLSKTESCEFVCLLQNLDESSIIYNTVVLMNELERERERERGEGERGEGRGREVKEGREERGREDILLIIQVLCSTLGQRP